MNLGSPSSMTVAASDRGHRDPGAPRDHAIAAAEHPEAKALAPVEHRARPEPLLRQLPPGHDGGVAVVRRVVGHAQGAAS